MRRPTVLGDVAGRRHCRRAGSCSRSASRSSAFLLLTAVLTYLRPHLGLPSILLLYLLAVVLVSAVGGMWPALATAVVAFLLANYYFTPPLHTFTIAEGDNLVALVVFLVVAAVVSGFVALASRRAAEGARARAESEALVRLGGSSSIATLLETLRRVLGLRGVVLFHRASSGWEQEAFAGDPVEGGGEPERGIRIDDLHVLVLDGYESANHDQRILDAFVAEIAAAIEVEELTAEVGTVSALVAAREARAALLASMGRGLQETAPGSRLRRPRRGTPRARPTCDGVSTASSCSGRTSSTSAASRVASCSSVRGRLDRRCRAAALRETCVETARVELDVAPTLPSVAADASLLRRALVEAVVEAIDASPPGGRVRIVAGAVWPGVDIRIIDRRGPGDEPGAGGTGGGGVRRAGLRARDAWARRGRRDARRRHDARDPAARVSAKTGSPTRTDEPARAL